MQIFFTVTSLFFLLLTVTASLHAQPAVSALADSRWLVHNGNFNGHIFLAQNASPEERESAQVLAHWITTVTGAAVTVTEENPDAGLRAGVYIGKTQTAAAHGITAPTRWGDAWRWETRGGRALFICGNSDTATRLAMGDFIQRHLGVTFLMPGEFGAEWSPQKSVRMPARPYTQKPAYAWRHLGVRNPEEKQWAFNNGLGKLPPMSHALFAIFDEKAWAKHPEFFSTVGGVVKKPTGRRGYEPQPNLAAPGAAAYAAGRAVAHFEKNPDAVTFSLGINDNMTWDESDVSAALRPKNKYFRARPDYSDYVFSFMNRAATTLWPKPDGVTWDAARWSDGDAAESPPSQEKLLSCIAYYHCENVPSFRLHPNVFPVVTADRSQWRDPAFRAEDYDLIRRWSQSGVRHFGLYDYYYGNDYVIPRIFYDGEIDSIRAGAKYGASLFYAEIAPNWGFDGAKAWLAGKLVQSPNLSATLLLREYYNKAYGAAAGDMRDFFEQAEACWNRQPGPARWIKFWRMENAGEIISPEAQRKMRASLDAAEAAFPFAVYPGRIRNEDALLRQQARVRMTSRAFAATERFLEYYRLRRDILNATPVTPEKASALLDLLQSEVTARNDFLDTLDAWRKMSLNPGAAPNWKMFFTGDVATSAFLRIAQHCDTAKPAWSDVRKRLGDWAGDAGLRPLLEKSDSKNFAAVTLASDGFDAASFRKPLAGSWADGRDIAVLRNLWRTVLFENQHVRFGVATAAPRTGDGALRICGSEQTTLTRYARVTDSGWVLAKVFCRGKINPGTYTGIEMRFYDFNGKPVCNGTIAILHPADYAEWTPLGCFAPVPKNAVTASVAIRSMSQESDEVLCFDDFSIEQIFSSPSFQ